MEIKPEDYVKKLKEISAKYSDAELINDVEKRGCDFEADKRVRCLCFDCLEDLTRETCPSCFGKKILFVTLDGGWVEKARAIQKSKITRPSKDPPSMTPLEFLEYYEQKIKEHPDKAGGAWALCLDHNRSTCACSGSKYYEGKDSGFVDMGSPDSRVVISQNKILDEGRALREANRISEELIKHAKNQTKVPYSTSEVIMSTPTPKPAAATADRVNKIAMAIDSIADDTLEASMRAAASQFVKLTREPLVAALTSGLGMEDNATSRAKVAKFLKSPLGDALVSGMLSAGVASLPVRADLKSGIAKELRVRAMGTAMDEAADLFMEPFRTVTAQLISGQASIGLLDSGEHETLNLEAKVEERVAVE